MKKWLVLSGVSIIAVAAVGAYVVNAFPAEIAPVADVDTASFEEDQIVQGENLTYLGDCAACHRPEGSRDMTGGIGLPTPFGTIYSTNITPDVDTGIGSWSFEAFDRAMREGIDRQGNHLYPAFPYDHFAAIAEDDMRALYAYLMVQDPVAAERKQNEMNFPFSYRPLVAGWKFLFHEVKPFEPNPEFNDEENRGYYLAETLGHCSACHSPRNALGAVDKAAYLEGGEAEGWLIPPLGAASIAPVAWDFDDYADYLFDGWSENHGIAGGPMRHVVDNLYDANEDDIFALAAWLDRITPEVDQDERAAKQEEIAALDLPESFDPASFDGPDNAMAGAQVFKDKCVKCHKERISDSQPISLGLSYSVNAAEPTNVFNIVLGGLKPTFASPERKMEAIDLSAEDLADVAAFVRWHFTDEPAWDGLDEKAAAAFENGGGH